MSHSSSILTPQVRSTLTYLYLCNLSRSEPKRAAGVAKGISSTPLSDFNEDSVLDDPHSTEGTEVKGDAEECKGDTECAEVAEGYLDSSMEEMDPTSPVVTGSGGNQEQEGERVCVIFVVMSSFSLMQ